MLGIENSDLQDVTVIDFHLKNIQQHSVKE